MNTKQTDYNHLLIHLLSNKQYAFKAYQALHPEDTITKLEDLEIIPADVFTFKQLGDDFCMKVNGQKLYLLSSQNYNFDDLCIRYFMHYMDCEEQDISKNGYSLYSDRPIPLLFPEFYVILDCEDENLPESIKLHNIYRFNPNGDLRVTIAAYKGNSKERKNIFDEFIFYVQRCNHYRNEYGDTLLAIEKTFQDCINENVLVDYISENKDSIIEIMLEIFKQENVIITFE